MADPKTADQALQTYIRPQTFPVAVRMLRPDEPIPERAKRPARDFGKLSMNCQVIDMARRYGWTIALTRDDHICSLGITALGFDRPTHLYSSGTLCEGMYTATKEAGARSEAAVDKFAPGEYGCLLVAPLDRATFEPHLVVVYANPAQVMRLTQAALWKSGGRLASSFQGRIVCADIIVTTMQTGEPQVILPCSGDRIFGQTQDHEMAFTIPWARMDEIVEGLEGTHRGGIRYPITQFMEYEAKMPPRYMEVNRLWDVEKGKGAYAPRDRVVAAYKRTFTDRVPVYPIVASYAGTLDGLSIEEYCTDPSKAIPAMIRYYERHQPDVVLAYNDLAKEAEATGCGVKYSDYVVPSIETHVLQEDKGKLATMEIPDPKRDGRLPGFLELCEGLVAAKLPTALGAVAVGPWTIAMLMRNPEVMLLDTFEDPEFIHALMRFTTEYTKRWGDAIAATKIGLSFSEPTASISLISPDNYREFVAPYHKELVDHFKAKKVGLTTHICGTTYPIYEDLIKAGFTTVSFDLDQQADPTLQVDQLARFMDVSKGRVVAIGNVDATLFERATKAQIEAEVRRCVDAVGDRSGFILSTSCEIPPRSNPEVVQWFMDAAKDYGRYERLGSLAIRRLARAAWPLVVGGTLTAASLALGLPVGSPSAQTSPPASRLSVGFLGVVGQASTAPLLRALDEGLREQGYVEGQNLVYERRFADGKLERLPALAAELARSGADVIVAPSNPVIAAVQHATATRPIVMVNPTDPVGAGFVKSLSRPGGNITGLSSDAGPEILAKRLQMLKELIPRLSRVAVLRQPELEGGLPALRAAAPGLGVTLQVVEIRHPEEIEGAFETMTHGRAEAVLLLRGALTWGRRQELAELALKQRLPTGGALREYAEAGLLFTYGPSNPDLYRRAARYVARIHQGARPGDLPVEQPTKFELVVNLRTAKALGLTIPPSVLAQADEVIR